MLPIHAYSYIPELIEWKEWAIEQIREAYIQTYVYTNIRVYVHIRTYKCEQTVSNRSLSRYVMHTYIYTYIHAYSYIPELIEWKEWAIEQIRDAYIHIYVHTCILVRT